MKIYFLNDLHNNVGDMLSKPVLEHFGIEVELVNRKCRGKILAIGSILSSLRTNDFVWGSGSIRDKKITAPAGVKFLAVRGPKTRSLISNAVVPEIYGDPALLLPLIYRPTIEIKHKIGIIPHYVDKKIAPIKDEHLIDIQADWKKVVDEILSCEKIISSSLHGIVIAEAYGIPAVWARYSDNIIGGDFKFQDYFLGTGRGEQKTFTDIEPIKNLSEIQQNLIKVLPWKK